MKHAMVALSSVQENIISPMEDSPIPDMAGKDANDGAGTSPRSQGKAFGYRSPFLSLKCKRILDSGSLKHREVKDIHEYLLS